MRAGDLALGGGRRGAGRVLAPGGAVGGVRVCRWWICGGGVPRAGSWRWIECRLIWDAWWPRRLWCRARTAAACGPGSRASAASSCLRACWWWLGAGAAAPGVLVVAAAVRGREGGMEVGSGGSVALCSTLAGVGGRDAGWLRGCVPPRGEGGCVCELLLQIWFEVLPACVGQFWPAVVRIKSFTVVQVHSLPRTTCARVCVCSTR